MSAEASPGGGAVATSPAAEPAPPTQFLVQVQPDGVLLVKKVIAKLVNPHLDVAEPGVADCALLMRAAYAVRAAGPGEFYADNVGSNRVAHHKNWDIRRVISVRDRGDGVACDPEWKVAWSVITSVSRQTFGWDDLPHLHRERIARFERAALAGAPAEVEFASGGAALLFRVDGVRGEFAYADRKCVFTVPREAAVAIAVDMARIARWPEPSGGYADYASVSRE